MEKKIGKINKAVFGIGGYQDVQIGVTFDLSGPGFSVGDFWGYWANDPIRGALWTTAEREAYLGKVVMRVYKLMKTAKVHTFNDLVDVPVEITFDSMKLKSWRILTEAL